ncbi:MAG TPA: putative glycolipid-binding domain-containing protein [Methylomirabilota bacterium]|jgi:hypothetical protein
MATRRHCLPDVSSAIAVRWIDWPGSGLEHLVLREGPDGVSAESVILGPGGADAFAARYRILCDGGWRVRRLEVSLVGADRGLELSSDGAGHWVDRTGTPRPDLAGAIDVDLSATPFTNTLPIRRLGLQGGQSGTIQVVYVLLPNLTVATARQRYTCLEPGRRYRYESLESDFTRDLEVDAAGLVVTYPDLFRRVP